MKALLDEGADVNEKAPGERLTAKGIADQMLTPLLLAAREGDAKIEDLSTSLLSAYLMLTFHQWSQHGPSRLRQMSVLDVKVEHIDHTADGIVLSGAVRWSRRQAGQATDLTERFWIDCPVPSLRKTPRSVRPTIALRVADGSGA